eukprot:scaffold208492_cov21-Prasinocladus_malaysianus.AAC.1
MYVSSHAVCDGVNGGIDGVLCRHPVWPGWGLDWPDCAALRQPRRHVHQAVAQQLLRHVQRRRRRVVSHVALPPSGQRPFTGRASHNFSS